MALVWSHGQTIVLANRTPPSRLSVLAAQWDRCNECFVLESRIVIPVAGDAELLAGGSVADSETGLFQSYIVSGGKSSISIWCLDLDRESSELVVNLPLPQSSTGTSRKSQHCVEGCCLVNGPIVIAVWRGQLLVLSSSKAPEAPTALSVSEFSEGSKDVHCEPVEDVWEAHLLSVNDSSEKQTLKLLFCGDITGDVGPEVIVSVTESSSKRLRKNLTSESERYLQNWSYLSLNLSTSVPAIPRHSCCSYQDRREPLKFFLSDKIPSELEPELISCIQPVAVVPSAANFSYDIYVGTKDRRLLRCSHGQIVAILHLEAIPSQLHFGVVAGGQGVIVVAQQGSQKVSAICAESHELLEVWSHVRQVVVGDFTSCGHDQIALLQSYFSVAENRVCSSLSQDEVGFTVIHGFSAISCAGPYQGSQQHLIEAKAINDCRVSALETICKALHQRIESGMADLKVAEEERVSKGELVRISSNIMQAMPSRSAGQTESECAHTVHGLKSIPGNDRVEVVRATRIWSRIYGMNWVLMADVEISDERQNTVLHDVSLLVTSLTGSIGGKSSVLKSISSKDGRACLALSIPLQNFCLLPGLPFHVVLRASEISRGSSQQNCENTQFPNRWCGGEYTQWLGASEVVHPTALKHFQTKEARTALEQECEVWEQQQFVITAKSEDHLLELSSYMQSALNMHQILDDKHQNSEGRFNLISTDGPYSFDANVCYISPHAIIRFRASDAQLMAMLQRSFTLLLIQHQYQVLSRMVRQETLETAERFIVALGRELEYLEMKDQNGKKDGVSSSSKLVIQQLQMATDSKGSQFVASFA